MPAVKPAHVSVTAYTTWKQAWEEAYSAHALGPMSNKTGFRENPVRLISMQQHLREDHLSEPLEDSLDAECSQLQVRVLCVVTVYCNLHET